MSDRSNRTGVFEAPQNPELEDLFRMVMRNLRLEMRTHTPCTVVAYAAATRRVTVNVDTLTVIKNLNVDPSLADPAPSQVQKPIKLVNIPVCFPGASPGGLTFPIVPGDTGSLHVHDRTLQQWMTLGIPTDPIGAFTHSLADSTFYPDLQPDPKAGATDPAATVLDGAAIIKLGAAAVEALAKAQSLVALMDTAIAAGVLAGTGAPGTTGTLAFTAFQTAWNLGKATIPTVKVRGE